LSLGLNEHSEEKQNIWKILVFVYHFRTLSKKTSVSRQTMFGGVIKTAFYLSTGSFWGKIFTLRKLYFFKTFSDIAQNNFACCRKLFDRIAKTAFYLSLGPNEHFGEKQFIWKILVFVNPFRTLSKKFSASRQTEFGGLSKLHSTSQLEHFEGKYVF